MAAAPSLAPRKMGLAVQRARGPLAHPGQRASAPTAPNLRKSSTENLANYLPLGKRILGKL
jgi:hypothetical protein